MIQILCINKNRDALIAVFNYGHKLNVEGRMWRVVNKKIHTVPI